MSSQSRSWVVLLTVFLDLLGFGILIPVAPFYARAFGAGDLEVAWLMGTYSLAQLVFVPPLAHLSDRVGRRRVMLGSIAGTAIAMVLFGAAASLPMLFFARFAHGAMTANLATAQAYLADTSDEANRAKAMGMLGAAFGVGFIVGPFFGGVLAEVGQALGIGYSLVGYGCAALSAANFVFAYFFLPEPPRSSAASTPRRRLRDVARLPNVTPVLVTSFLAIFAFSHMTATYALLTMDRLGWTAEAGGARLNGYVFAGIGVVGVTIQGGLIGRLVARFGEAKLVVWGGLITAVGLAGLAFTHSVAALLAASLITSIGHSVGTPPLSSLLSVRTPADSQGGAFGVGQAVNSLARMLGPMSGGVLYEFAGASAPFFLAGALCVASSAALFVAERRRSAREAIP